MDPLRAINGRQVAWLIIKKLNMDDTDRTLMEFDGIQDVILKGDTLIALTKDWDFAVIHHILEAD